MVVEISPGSEGPKTPPFAAETARRVYVRETIAACALFENGQGTKRVYEREIIIGSFLKSTKFIHPFSILSLSPKLSHAFFTLLRCSAAFPNRCKSEEWRDMVHNEYWQILGNKVRKFRSVNIIDGIRLNNQTFKAHRVHVDYLPPLALNIYEPI
ncbi:protein Wnt-9a [Striga asiatica]|uniref:Protein Wnt-9a n=1 Tax=Striga asiatica TaxID=4170 RepID=A0A5A7NWL6_STRAF|nr:protein Wnt-9a [Striga asiatica]